ncbi:DVU0298 family protein [Thermodesulfobacteriota bacterium]
MGSRKLKKKILELLSGDDFEKHLESICRLPGRQSVNPLFSFFYNADELIRWRAVTAMGAVVSSLADQDMESARVVMRRLIWNLNDESGGIGWGSPEAMGEIMARHRRLAEEYHRILVSYVDENGNFIEHEMLQRGVLWGLGRFAHARPECANHAAPFLLPFLRSDDATHRGLAAWAAGAFQTDLTQPLLECLIGDKNRINIFVEMRLVERQVGQLAREAILMQKKKLSFTTE